MKYDNPRYIAYAQANGKSPDEMMAHDEEAWPGGIMCGFMLWISKQKQAFFRANPGAFLDRWTIQDQAAWTSWLQAAGRHPH